MLIPGISPNISAKLSKMPNKRFILKLISCYLLCLLFTAVMAAALPFRHIRSTHLMSFANSMMRHSLHHRPVCQTANCKQACMVCFPSHPWRFSLLTHKNRRTWQGKVTPSSPTVIHLECNMQFQAPRKTQKERSYPLLCSALLCSALL